MTQPTQAERDQVLRVKLLSDFMFFLRYFFKIMYGKSFVVAPHHTKIAEALVRVVSGECRRLIINIAPRYGKTELAVKMFMAWTMANNAAARNMHLSYSGELAMDNSSAIKDIIKCDEFQRLFNVSIRSDTDSRQKWYTEEGGGLYATAAGASVTGFGAGAIERVYEGTGSPCDGFPGCILIDDPLKPGDASSEAVRNTVNERFNNTIASRTNSEDTPIILIMQRLHDDDLSGFLLDGGSGDEWEHLCIPAINDDGTPLWPEKHSIERLEAMRRADPYTFAGQYMQSPSPLGGGVFKDEWWKYHKVAPATLYRYVYADTAQKIKEINDYSVLQCWGKTPKGIVLLDQLRGKWLGPELKKRAREFWAKHKAVAGMGTLRAMKIEDKASGTGLIQDLVDEGEIPVVAIQRNIDKHTRACDTSPYIESGYVSIPEDAEWVSDYKHEFSSFPNGKHDDQIDPTMDAIEDMLQGVDMQFISSEVIIDSMHRGSGVYLGTDPLICGVHIARDATEQSWVQFRRGKDACSEKVYNIGWEASSNPERMVKLLSKVLDTHRPDISLISESGMGGMITNRLIEIGYNAIRIRMQEKPIEDLKYKDTNAEAYSKMRGWLLDEGSISSDAQMEQAMVSVIHEHNGRDQMVITTSPPRVSALAVTFAIQVPSRHNPRGELDSAIGLRDKSTSRDYDPLDGM